MTPMIELTEDQIRGIALESPPRVVAGDTEYVLVRSDVYDRVKSLLEDWTPDDEEQRFRLAEMGRRAGWDDPDMDAYNDLDPRRTP